MSRFGEQLLVLRDVFQGLSANLSRMQTNFAGDNTIDFDICFVILNFLGGLSF